MPYVHDQGVKLWYQIDGRSGEPIVNIGGFGLLHDQFAEVSGHLSEVFQVINWNYRGAGNSDRTFLASLSLDRWVDDLEVILSDLNLDTVHLWGTSTGASIAIRYAARYPQRVQSVITYPMVKTNAASRAGMNAFLTVAETFGYDALAKLTQWLGSAEENVFGPKGDELAQFEAASFRRNFDIEDLAHTLQIFSHCNLAADVQKLSMPVLLLLGQSGHLGAASRGVSKDIQKFTTLCPHAETKIIKNGGGTYCMIENPSESAEAVKNWISKCAKH